MSKSSEFLTRILQDRSYHLFNRWGNWSPNSVLNRSHIKSRLQIWDLNSDHSGPFQTLSNYLTGFEARDNMTKKIIFKRRGQEEEKREVIMVKRGWKATFLLYLRAHLVSSVKLFAFLYLGPYEWKFSIWDIRIIFLFFFKLVAIIIIIIFFCLHYSSSLEPFTSWWGTSVAIC